MAKTKREYILATCFLSGVAAIISFVSLGTQEWVTSDTVIENTTQTGPDTLRFGLFGGVFRQSTATDATIELSMVCLLDKNICALLCGDNMSANLEKLYNNENISRDEITDQCAIVTQNREAFFKYTQYFIDKALRSDSQDTERKFINAGVWVSTIVFLCASAVMGLVSAGLALWNTASNPYQVYFSIFGLYIYNAIALFCSLLTVILWGVMYSTLLVDYDIPTYKTFVEKFHTAGYASLGYSYWINLVSLFLYMTSISVLYIRNYLISKEPEVKVHLEDNSDPVIYLY